MSFGSHATSALNFPLVLELCNVIDWSLTFSVDATSAYSSTVKRYLTSSAKFVVPVAVGSPSAPLE
jgi:hypothetical protein